MFTDIVGYSAMMSKDESKALRILKANKILHKELLQQFPGELLKEIGDGMLLSFPNVSDAIAYASAIHYSAKQNETTYRIGIHTGECELRGEDLSGLAVHIAAPWTFPECSS